MKRPGNGCSAERDGLIRAADRLRDKLSRRARQPFLILSGGFASFVALVGISERALLGTGGTLVQPFVVIEVIGTAVAGISFGGLLRILDREIGETAEEVADAIKSLEECLRRRFSGAG